MSKESGFACCVVLEFFKDYNFELGEVKKTGSGKRQRIMFTTLDAIETSGSKKRYIQKVWGDESKLACDTLDKVIQATESVIGELCKDGIYPSAAASKLQAVLLEKGRKLLEYVKKTMEVSE